MNTNTWAKRNFGLFLLHEVHVKILLVVLISLAVNNYSYGQSEPEYKQRDSLKIYFIGHFKNETFRIYQDSFVYEVKMKRRGPSTWGPQVFRIHIALPDSLNTGDFLNIVIKRKAKYGLFFRNTKTYFHYRDDLQYLIVWREFRFSDRFPFHYEWNCKPPLVKVSNNFWEKDGDTKNVIKTKNKKGSIDAGEVMSKERLKWKPW